MRLLVGSNLFGIGYCRLTICIGYLLKALHRDGVGLFYCV